jgi:plasmid stability protein
MRTTLDLDDSLMRKLKARAATEGETMTRLVENAIRRYLSDSSAASPAFELKLLAKRGKTVAGIDFDDRESIYEAMERP